MQSYIRTIIIFNSKIFPLKFYKSTVNNSYIMLNLSKKYIMLVKIPNDLFIIVFKNKFLCFSKKFITLKLFKSLIFNKAILNYFFS